MKITVNADAEGGKVGELLSHNVFAYCMNNPVNMSDPDGHWSIWTTLAVVAVAVLVVVAVAVFAPGVLVAAVGMISSAAGGLMTAAAVIGTKLASVASRAGPATVKIVGKVSGSGQGAASKNVQKIKSVLQSSKRVTLDGSIRESIINENTKVVFKRHIDEFAHPIKSKGYMDSVNHYNIEIHTRIGNSARFKVNGTLHLILDSADKVIKIF